MSADLNFVEAAAVDALRKMIALIDAGVVGVVEFAATDKPDTWGVVVRVARLDASTTTTTTTTTTRPGGLCPDCGRGMLEDVVDALACTDCGRTHPFPPQA